MIIVFKAGATEEQISYVQERLVSYGYKYYVSREDDRTFMRAIGDESVLRDKPLGTLPGVEKVMPIQKPYKLVSRDFQKEDTIVDINGIKIGGGHVQVMAGPCSVENRDMLMSIAEKTRKAGARILRGGAFKPRTSPYAFQGLGVEGLKYLREAADANDMLVITEIMDPRDAEVVCEYSDILQIGARNMMNFRLLREVGKLKKPVMLKRGLCANIKDFLMAAEYIASEGTMDILLCERGIRSFETETRNTLDLSAVPVLKSLSHLPVVVDPSHGTGRRDCILPMSQAGVAAGADGLMVEVHECPEEAFSDGDQSIVPADFATLMQRITVIAGVLDKTIG